MPSVPFLFSMSPIMILLQQLTQQCGRPGEHALLGTVSSASCTGDDGRWVAEEKEEELPLGGILHRHHAAQYRSPLCLLQVNKCHKSNCVGFFLFVFLLSTKVLVFSLSRHLYTFFIGLPAVAILFPEFMLLLLHVHIQMNEIVYGHVSMPCVSAQPQGLCPCICFHLLTLCHLCLWIFTSLWCEELL